MARRSGPSGFGRPHAHYPGSAGVNLTAPAGWGWQTFSLPEGYVRSWSVGVSGPEPSEVTQWKWALTWFNTDLESSSDVTIRVRDSCDGYATVAGDWSYDFRKRVHLRQSDITGRCLVMEATAWKGGPQIYTADYYHSGNPNEH